MKDKYIEKTIEIIRDLIHKEEYSLVGKKFVKLTDYGIVLENKLLILICSELADVFFHSIDEAKIYEKEIDKNKLNEVISSSDNLLKFLLIEAKNLKPEDKQEIFELLLSTISNSETIQASINIISRKKRVIRQGFREEIL